MDLDGIKLSELPITQQPPIDGTLVISSATEGSKRINLAAFIQYLKENGDFNKFLNGLEDVVINSPVERQVLGYDEHFGKWTNIAGGNEEINLSDLSDIEVTLLKDGQYLKYDNTSHKWINVDGPADGIIYLNSLDELPTKNNTEVKNALYCVTSRKLIPIDGDIVSGGGDYNNAY